MADIKNAEEKLEKEMVMARAAFNKGEIPMEFYNNFLNKYQEGKKQIKDARVNEFAKTFLTKSTLDMLFIK